MKRFLTLLLAVTLVIGALICIAPKALAATTVTVIDSSGINMREGPGTSYKKVIGIPINTTLTVQQIKSAEGYTWGKVTYNSKTGWIALEYTDYNPSDFDTDTPTVSKGNWMQSGGKWYYYINGVMQTGWVNDGGKWYYMNSNGVMQTGWVNDGGKWYYMNSSGIMQTGWKSIGGTWYYMDGSGVMQTGWLKLGAAHYYLNSSGAMHTGWLKLGANWYYMDSSGVMAVGKTFVDGQPNKFSLDGVWQGVTANAFSSEAMQILKLEEGFSRVPYWDYSQWTVGYGTKCPDDMLDYYKANGIPEADAQILLVKHMDEIETVVDNFIAKYALTLAPNEYDAVVLFSYNCGTGWCNETSGTFHNVIKNKATGNDLIRAFSIWNGAGGEFKDFLMRRRLSEANMYLNGVYSTTPPNNFCYVRYDPNGGTVSPKAQGYDSDLTATPYQVPTYAGYTFDGWYTAKTGGTKVTVLDATHNETILYAHWNGANQKPTPPAQEGPATVTVKVTNGPVNVRTGPSVDNPRLSIGTVNQGVSLTLTEYALGKVDKQTGEIGAWGKFTELGGGWVCLSFTDYDTAKQQITASRWARKDGKYYCYLGIEPQKGWQKYNDQWYYTNASGMMVTGWVKDAGQWYYMHTNGAMAYGWLRLGGAWYYFKTGGVMTIGWQKVGNIWYYFNADGVMVTGWNTVGGSWYYFDSDGAMKVGWLQLGNTWYYLKPGGAMATGWVQVYGTWYYFSAKGEMATGWVKDGGKWYYMNTSGAMVTGWLQLGKDWFYLDSGGVMVTGKKTIGPVTYTFASNGVWIG